MHFLSSHSHKHPTLVLLSKASYQAENTAFYMVVTESKLGGVELHLSSANLRLWMQCLITSSFPSTSCSSSLSASAQSSLGPNSFDDFSCLADLTGTQTTLASTPSNPSNVWFTRGNGLKLSVEFFTENLPSLARDVLREGLGSTIAQATVYDSCYP